MKTTTYIELSYDEVESLVEKHYGYGRRSNIEYCFVSAQECGNDTSHKFNVSAEDYNEDDWQDAIENDFSYHNNTVLNKLCKDGHIEPGKYIVNVCW